MAFWLGLFLAKQVRTAARQPHTFISAALKCNTTAKPCWWPIPAAQPLHHTLDARGGLQLETNQALIDPQAASASVFGRTLVSNYVFPDLTPTLAVRPLTQLCLLLVPVIAACPCQVTTLQWTRRGPLDKQSCAGSTYAACLALLQHSQCGSTLIPFTIRIFIPVCMHKANCTEVKHGGVWWVQVPQTADRVLGINVTQPLLEATGQVRWAFNNIVEPLSPPCTPVLQNIFSDPEWVEQHLAPPGFVGDPNPFVQVLLSSCDRALAACLPCGRD